MAHPTDMNNQILHSGLAQRVMAGLKRRRSPAMGLRMTAMIDVIFLLLTFFVLTARFKQPESHLNVTLPKPVVSATQSVSEGPLSVQLKAVDNGCQVILTQADKIILRPETIDTNLAELNARFPSVASSYNLAEQGVELHCDNAVQWDYVVKVYDVLYQMGVTKITFVTEK
jgi:biopolymer transport protein ExbD